MSTADKAALLPIARLLIDPEQQARGREDTATVSRIARELRGGGSIRVPVLVQAGFGHYTLRDGFHRVRACILAGQTTVPAIVFHGTPSETFGAVLANNTEHGGRWNSRDIARHVVNGLRDSAFRDPDGTPWSISRLGRDHHAAMGKSPDAARRTIERAAKAAAKTDHRVAAELELINAAHKPDCATDSSERPSPAEMSLLRLQGVERDAQAVADMLAAKLKKLPKAMRRAPLRKLLKLLPESHAFKDEL